MIAPSVEYADDESDDNNDDPEGIIPRSWGRASSVRSNGRDDDHWRPTFNHDVAVAGRMDHSVPFAKPANFTPQPQPHDQPTTQRAHHGAWRTMLLNKVMMQQETPVRSDGFDRGESHLLRLIGDGSAPYYHPVPFTTPVSFLTTTTEPQKTPPQQQPAPHQDYWRPMLLKVVLIATVASSLLLARSTLFVSNDGAGDVISLGDDSASTSGGSASVSSRRNRALRRPNDGADEDLPLNSDLVGQYAPTKADGDEGDGGCSVECCLHHYFPYSSYDYYSTTAARSLADSDEEPCEPEAENPISSGPFVLNILIVAILCGFSALFSGLTLGLMSLDKIGLEIVMEGDDPALARAARKIYPVRENGNLLLCTLLLGNVAVNALLSILMADLTSGTVGFVLSTAIIVIFGEILPQAACSRYALQIGEKAVPLVKIIIILLFPIAFPLSYALNKLLGHELGTTYSKAEMSKLLEIHVKHGRFDAETGTAMTGALKYQDMTVKEVMTSIETTFMLNAEEKLSFDTIARIFKTGYSRIPVYEVSVNNVIGLLFVKDLIFVDPDDETPVKNFVQIFGRGLHVVWPDDTLGDVLRELKTGRSHMALVRDVNATEHPDQDPFYEIRGIITLEDIIEVILGDDIVDETDAFVDAEHSIKVDRTREETFDWARLRLLDAKLVDETLSEDETLAVSAHLRTNHGEAMELLSDRQLKKLVAETPVLELDEARREVGMDVPPDAADLLYSRNASTTLCTLLLSGKVTVLAGSDQFRSDVGAWSVLATKALTDHKYKPDFTAFVSNGPCRCLRITRERFEAAVDATAAERRADVVGHPPALTSAHSSPTAAVGAGTAGAAPAPATTQSTRAMPASAPASVHPPSSADSVEAGKASKAGATASAGAKTKATAAVSFDEQSTTKAKAAPPSSPPSPPRSLKGSSETSSVVGGGAGNKGPGHGKEIAAKAKTKAAKRQHDEQEKRELLLAAFRSKGKDKKAGEGVTTTGGAAGEQGIDGTKDVKGAAATAPTKSEEVGKPAGDETAGPSTALAGDDSFRSQSQSQSLRDKLSEGGHYSPAPTTTAATTSSSSAASQPHQHQKAPSQSDIDSGGGGGSSNSGRGARPRSSSFQTFGSGVDK